MAVALCTGERREAANLRQVQLPLQWQSVTDPLLAPSLVFLGSTMVTVHSLNWKDVATRKDDNVFDDFAGAQVLPLNLRGIRNGPSSNSTSLCQWHNPGFTNKRLVLNVSAGLPGTCSSQLHQNNNNYRDSGS